MRYKSIFNLISLPLLVGIIFISDESFSAQPTLKEQSKKKDFGWSLKKFEKKGKDSSRDKETNQQNSKQSEDSDDETIRIETNLVINDVLVVNEKGNAILGLKQSDFVIIEDGEPQKVELFSFGENAALPRSVVLIFRNGLDAKYNIKNNIEAAKTLVDRLSLQDKMAIVTPDLKLILYFTQDKTLLKKTLDKLSSNLKGNPSVNYDYGTLMAVLGEMFDEEDARPIVIFQSLGTEFGWLKGEFSKSPKEAQDFWENIRQISNYPESYRERGYSFSDVLERIEKSRATIYSIVPTMQFAGLPREEQLRRARISIEEWMRRAVKEKSPNNISSVQNENQSNEADAYVKDQTAMMQVAKLSGGYTEFLESPEDAQRVYETIFKVINNRYTMGYYSTNQTRDGKRHNIKIEVRDHPEYIIVGRKFYIAAKGDK